MTELEDKIRRLVQAIKDGHIECPEELNYEVWHSAVDTAIGLDMIRVVNERFEIVEN
jgi:hypothetical protein